MRLGKCETRLRRRVVRWENFLLIHAVNDICVCVRICVGSEMWVVISSLASNAFLWAIVDSVLGRVNGKKWLMAVSAFSSQRAHFPYISSRSHIFIRYSYMSFSMLCTLRIYASCSVLYPPTQPCVSKPLTQTSLQVSAVVEKKQRNNNNNIIETKLPIWSTEWSKVQSRASAHSHTHSNGQRHGKYEKW